MTEYQEGRGRVFVQDELGLLQCRDHLIGDLVLVEAELQVEGDDLLGHFRGRLHDNRWRWWRRSFFDRWTTDGVNHNAQRCVGTLVAKIGDTVAVAVQWWWR